MFDDEKREVLSLPPRTPVVISGVQERFLGFALFRLWPTPCPSGIPLPWEGGRWATHPASPSFWKVGDRFFTTSPSFLWKEMARSVGSWLRSLFAFGQPPVLRASPFHGKGGRWVTHPASPSFLWKEVARSAGGWLRSFPPSANPLPWEGGRWATHP